MKYILLIIGLALAFTLVQASIVGWKIAIGKMLARSTTPFSYTSENPTKRVLFVGDSTAYGTGAKTPEQSTAGYLHQDFPHAEIINISKNGAKTGDLKKMITQAAGKFDLVVIQGGANDILYFTPLSQSKKNMEELLQEAKKYSNNVLLLTAGDIGSVPMFPPPLSWTYTARTKKFLSAFASIAKEQNVSVVDIYQEKENNIFSTDPKRYYAADGLHLSGDGYKIWYDQIVRTIEESNIQL